MAKGFKAEEKKPDLRPPNNHETMWLFQDEKGRRCTVKAKYWYNAKQAAQCILKADDVLLLENDEQL